MASSSCITNTPMATLRILMGEIQLLMAVMQKSSGWVEFDNGGNPSGTDTALWRGFKASNASRVRRSSAIALCSLTDAIPRLADFATKSVKDRGFGGARAGLVVVSFPRGRRRALHPLPHCCWSHRKACSRPSYQPRFIVPLSLIPRFLFCRWCSRRTRVV